MNKSKIFIISGPSGAGEDSVIEGLKKKFDIEKIVTTTTREKRIGETEGKDYYFISRKEFEKKIKDNYFAEFALQYNGNLYGVSHDELERVQKCSKIALWKIEYKGVITVKKKYPEIKAIFLMTENLEILERRIRKRDNATEEYIKERMEYTKEWLKNKDIYDYEVINKEGKLNEAIEETARIINSNI